MVLGGDDGLDKSPGVCLGRNREVCLRRKGPWVCLGRSLEVCLGRRPEVCLCKSPEVCLRTGPEVCLHKGPEVYLDMGPEICLHTGLEPYHRDATPYSAYRGHHDLVVVGTYQEEEDHGDHDQMPRFVVVVVG